MTKTEGYVDEYGQARVNIAVCGRKMEITVSPIIDTGFDGDICLPLPIAIQLGLELSGSVEIELADGSIKQEMVFSGLTKFGEEVKKARITLTESMDALIGTKMFSHLELDFDEKSVRID